MTHLRFRRAACLAGRFTFLLLAAALLAGCAQTKLVDSWQTEEKVNRKPGKVAVIAVLPEALIRESVERDVAEILTDKGTPAVPASRLPGMGGGIRGEIDTEVATGLLRKAGVDGVIVMFYTGGGRTGNYERSNYWTEYLGSGVGYSWGSPYFVDVYTVRQGADVVSFEQTIFVESSYFDMETEMPVWRIVTETKDVEHADAASDIAGKIASEMRSAGLN
ncbi:MAG: hypothetical protein EHM68_04370 [Lysobacterales bacterium]|nr:MAG: hypothetical protein EHM68_04370 [Xanthomonadales bacterium]